MIINTKDQEDIHQLRILPFFDHLPTSAWTFLQHINVDKNMHFLDHLGNLSELGSLRRLVYLVNKL